jgi:hypothetical protein
MIGERSRDVVLKVNTFCPTYIVDHFCNFFFLQMYLFYVNICLNLIIYFLGTS